MVRIFKAAGVYFLLLAGAGFVLGILCSLALAAGDCYPYTHHRSPVNLLQAPLMFVVTLVVARSIVSRSGLPKELPVFRQIAFVSLVCVLVGEFCGVLWFEGLTVVQYFADPEGVAVSAYVLLLAFLAMVPFFAHADEGQGRFRQAANREGREYLEIWSKVGRVLASLGIGLVLTVLYHVLVVLAWDVLHLSDRSLLVQVLVAPGIVLVSCGFENQVMILPVNVVAFFLGFSYLSWMYLRRRTQR